ncbi:MAG: urea carboxylase-associated family protein [Planctomycetes bacterium]|nr:urea carboxylase-associated family protein [Planctomycetota bacterium]
MSERSMTLQPGTAVALRLSKGTMLGVRDVAGHQSCELWAFDATNPAEHLDPSVTMEVVGRLWPTEKSKFYSVHYEPLLTLVEDTVNRHDLMQPSSSKQARMLFYGEDGRREGCAEWAVAALASVGVTLPALPRPVHLFRRTDVDAEGIFSAMEAPAQPGQGVVLHCERDLIVVIANPDDEISLATGCNPTAIALEY